MKRLDDLATAFVLILGGLVAETAAGTGPIQIAGDYPHSFQYQSGERFFPMGDTAYYLIGRPKEAIAHYIDVRRAHKFKLDAFRAIDAFVDALRQFGKPVIDEEPGYDMGGIASAWNSQTPETMRRTVWTAAVAGAYTV